MRVTLLAPGKDMKSLSSCVMKTTMSLTSHACGHGYHDIVDIGGYGIMSHFLDFLSKKLLEGVFDRDGGC